MFTRTYGELYEQNAHIFTSLFADLRAYYVGTDLDLGAAIDSCFGTLMLRMFRLMNAQYSFDGNYLRCVAASMHDLVPFGDVPQKLGVQLRRSMIAARTYYQGLVIGRRVVDALMPVSHSSLMTTGREVERSEKWVRKSRGLESWKGKETYGLWKIALVTHANGSRLGRFFSGVCLSVCLSVCPFVYFSTRSQNRCSWDHQT